MRKIVSIFVGLVTLLYAYFFFIAPGIAGLHSDRKFEAGTSRTTGTVQSLWTTTHGRGNPEYDADYHYLTEHNGFQDTSQRISPNSYARLHVGDPVPVKYLLGNPWESRIDWADEDEWQWIKDAGTLIKGILIVGGVFIAGWLALPRKKATWEDAAVKMDLGGRDRFS